ncbi:MAG: hypothetical protein IPP40_08690 [bacterium]|nr:hypothetical protein [bacterium]
MIYIFDLATRGRHPYGTGRLFCRPYSGMQKDGRRVKTRHYDLDQLTRFSGFLFAYPHPVICDLFGLPQVLFLPYDGLFYPYHISSCKHLFTFP